MKKLFPSRDIDLYINGRGIYTKNLVPGQKVYGEEIIRQHGIEYRRWDPRRSKLCALLHKKVKVFPFQQDTRVLYLGAGSGTTASHISDIVCGGVVYCIEFSPRTFHNLLGVCEKRMNMLPIMANANHQRSYKLYVEKVDVVYQDIAQRNQVEIFLKNTTLFLKKGGYAVVMIKSRSIDVTMEPKQIYNKVENELGDSGLEVLVKQRLEPHEKDHMAFVTRVV